MRARRTGCASGSQVYRDAGVGTLIITPLAFDAEERKRMVRELAELV